MMIPETSRLNFRERSEHKGEKRNFMTRKTMPIVMRSGVALSDGCSNTVFVRHTLEQNAFELRASEAIAHRADDLC
jgi:hypothetical protein